MFVFLLKSCKPKTYSQRPSSKQDKTPSPRGLHQGDRCQAPQMGVDLLLTPCRLTFSLPKTTAGVDRYMRPQ